MNTLNSGTQIHLYIERIDGTRASGCAMSSSRKFSEEESRLAREFIRVFNDDIRSASEWGRHEELWLSLQQTRLSRVIARVSPFHTPIFLKWLRAFENAVSLRYERQPFSIQLVLTKQLEWIKSNPAVDYVKFSSAMTLSAALFEEKWVRSLAAGEELALVGMGHDKGVSGIMYVKGKTVVDETKLIAPHTKLNPLCATLVPGTMAFLASPQGDLRVLFPNGSTFTKSQGSWSMSNLMLLQNELGRVFAPAIAQATTRLAADLSYEGHGAVLCFVSDPKSVNDLVPDHSDKDRVNYALRLMSRRLNVLSEGHQIFIKKVSGIDGAIVFDFDGNVLDAGCMISDPPEPLLLKAGFDKPRRFAGARSTAAWNASLRGIAIKISEDGPITVYNKGEAIMQI